MNRRQFIATSSAALACVPFGFSATSPESTMGLSLASYAIRWKSSIESSRFPAFTSALDVMHHSHAIGARGVQVGVGGWAKEFAGKVREAREQMGLYLEGQIALPVDSTDVSRFEQDVLHAREAGAKILRTVCLRGRRYESFNSLDAYRAFERKSYQSLTLAEPVMKRNQVGLAVENHKDWRVPELIQMMKHFDSEWIGVTLDTGNNISLLEDPMTVVESLAPYAMTTHFKDMAVQEYEDGFLLAEVPLGEGMLDLKKIVQVCKKYNPTVTFNLEMITRDPLKIPCMSDAYWETFDALPGKDLARTLRMVEEKGEKAPLSTLSDKNPEERLAFEEENVRSSFTFAREELGLI